MHHQRACERKNANACNAWQRNVARRRLTVVLLEAQLQRRVRAAGLEVAAWPAGARHSDARMQARMREAPAYGQSACQSSERGGQS